MITKEQIEQQQKTVQYLSNCLFWMKRELDMGNIDSVENSRKHAMDNLNKLEKFLNVPIQNASANK